ncbi:hypothetical protein [Brevibacterium limosum]|uniref:hypothetical protein n=1 Tax=Brevibacterium limosum TaxID=2697565 RepID=UPI001421DEC0|nr:hypothetical protein [Brevibacterium limosum]
MPHYAITIRTESTDPHPRRARRTAHASQPGPAPPQLTPGADARQSTDAPAWAFTL